MECHSIAVRRGLPLLMFLVTFVVETDSFSAAVTPSSSPFASLISATTTTTRTSILCPTTATTDARFCSHGLTRTRFSSSFLSGRTSTIRLAASTQAKEADVTSKSGTEQQQQPYSFIQTELRGAAMKLHTKSQAPREGQANEPERKPHVTTHANYLAYLVDNLHVYQAFEEIVRQHSNGKLGVFVDTGLERCEALEQDIDYLMQTYQLPRPAVAAPGRDYAQLLRNLSPLLPDRVPEFMCHYYNFYFAHTAGGRMIGKQLSAQLLDKKTLQFYTWNKGDLNDLKDAVKASIEDMAATWNAEQKQQCVDATAAAFMYGGAINGHLSGRVSS